MFENGWEVSLIESNMLKNLLHYIICCTDLFFMNSSKKKQTKEAIMKNRERKREKYLQQLQKEGRYNPVRPSKPDPERWIPKNQRSYNRRGRKGRTKFLGAQGIGSGAGAEKDAAKLDAYARAAAKAAGKDLNGGAPSTAHLSVSSNSTRRRR